MDHARGSGKRLQPSASDSFSTEPDLEGFDDFTIASSWEKFIAGVEDACRDWLPTPRSELLAAGAEKVEAVKNVYKVTQELSSDSQTFRLEFYFQATSEDDREDWKDGLHQLQLWFNVTDFLVISPLNVAEGVEPSEASLLLSTVAVALANCGSQLPAFVPVHESKRTAYQGILGTNSYSARFEADRITSWVPVRLMHLEGLYDLFVSKLAYKTLGDLSAPSVSVEFSMRLTYRTPMRKVQSDVEGIDESKLIGKGWDAACSWGEWHALEDPVKGFELVTTWRRRTVKGSLEMAEFENASTLEADKWLISLMDTPKEKNPEKEESVGFAGRLPSLVLAFHVANEATFVEDFAAGDKPYIQHITQSLDLPDPVDVDRVLKDIFQEDKRVTGCGEMNQEFAHGIKGSPSDSLFSRFCLHALQFGGCNIRAIAVLWIEFVREVRLFWNEADRLPRMALDSSPDPSACLLHQKLQLLQVCIQHAKPEKKIAEDAPKVEQKEVSQGGNPDSKHVVEEAKPSDANGSQEDDSQDEISSEEKWQDTTDEQLEMDTVFSPQEVVRKSRTKPKHRPSAPSKIQEPMKKEQEASNGNESRLVASDMAASKAANSGDNVEDVVRSSSTSTAASENSAGTSGRREMADLSSEPAMWWRQMWASKKAAEQPCIDYTREAEKVLHYLDTIRPQELVAQMLATSYVLVADGLKSTVSEYMVSPTMTEQLEELYTSMTSLLPSLYTPKQEGEGYDPDVHINLLHLCSMFERVEGNVLLAVSLGQKLKGTPRLLADFLDNYVGRKGDDAAPRLLVQGVTPRRWKEGGATERELVSTLFPALGPTQAWKRSLRMGNFLNGHEPVRREIVLSSCYDLMDHYSDGSQRQRVSTKDVYTHRMYLCGTSNDLQVALSVKSSD